MHEGPKLSILRDLRLTAITFLKREMITFDKIGALKTPHFRKKLKCDLLDDQVDTLSIIWRPNYWTIHRIMSSFMVIFVKIREKH